MRLTLRAAGFLALAVVAITCTDAPTAPNSSKHAQSAQLRMSPYFTADAAKIYNSLYQFGQEVTEVHIHLTAVDGTQRDTVLTFPAGADSIIIDIPVPAATTDQVFNAVIELRNDQHTVLFSGTQTVIARASNLPPISTPSVDIHYAGPGKATKAVNISPVDPTINASATTVFSASGIDSSNNAVSDLLVRWTTSDATLATVTSTSNTTASVTGLGRRGVVTVSAITPNGVVGTSRLTLVPAPARIVVISGSGQSGVTGAALPQPFVVEVQGTDNLPVSGQIVNFRSVSAGGSVTPSTVVTDGSGRASASITLPRSVGTHLFEASTGSLAAVTVSETATAAQAAAIAIVSGDQQTDSVGRTLPIALGVKVSDQFGSPVSGASVSFARTAGAGSVANATVATGPDGTASTAYTLGNVVGVEGVSATVAGVAGGAGTVSFTLHTIARAASSVAILSGGGQSGIPGTVLAAPLVAKVVDALNNPLASVGVTWTASNPAVSFSPTTGTTDATGQTSTQVTLGGVGGAVTVTARAGTAAASTTLTVNAVVPPTITKTSGDGQSAIAGTAVTVNPTVQLKDGTGAPAQGVQVVFAVASGGGTATGTTATTNASGVATVGSWTLGAVAGPNTLTATSGTLTTTFNATGTVGTANRLAFVQAPPSSITVGATIASPVKVRLTDANNNPVTTAGVAITLTGVVTPGSSPNITQTQTTDATGTATFALSPYTGVVGTIVFTATAPGTAALASPSIPITAGAATQLVMKTQPPATASSGAALTPAPQVQVADAGGNAVAIANVVVNAVIASGTGTLTGASSTSSDAAGVATFSTLIINGTAGPRTLQFSTPGLTNVISTSVTLGAGTPVTMSKNAGDGQSATAGTPVTIAPSVLVRDASANPVPGVSVTFAATSGGGSITGASATTNAQGIATAGSWTLGNAAGANTLTASAGALSVVFNATAVAGSGSKIVVSQVPTAVTVGAGPFVVKGQLQDALGNSVSLAGVAVGLSAVLTPGSAPPYTQSATTDAAGVATFNIPSYTGPIGQLQFTLSSAGYTSGTAGPIPVQRGALASLVIAVQPSATAIQTVALAQQPVIQLADAGGNAITTAGVGVHAFISSGTGGLSGTVDVVTDAAGLAHFTDLAITGGDGTRTIGFSSGTLVGTASTQITGHSGTAAALLIVSGQAQTAQVNTSVATAPTVRVNDAFGNPVAGASVTFTPHSTNGAKANGSTAPVTLSTPANGQVSVGWLLGTVAATASDTLEVTTAGVGVTRVFTATATPGVATRLAMLTQPPASAQSGVALNPAPQVKYVDAFGNASIVSGVVVTASIASGGGSVTGVTQATSDAAGIATFPNLSITGVAGSRTLQFGDGIRTAVTSSVVTIGAGAATTISLNAGDGQTAAVGATVPIPPSVKVTDAAGNPVAGASVTFTASGGSQVHIGVATATSLPQTTNASGIATADWIFSNTAGTQTLLVTSGTLSGSPVTFHGSATAGSASKFALVSGLPTSLVVGVAPASPIVVRITDAFGNPVSTAGVNIAATGNVQPSNLSFGASAVTDASGVASFTIPAYTGPTGTATLTFTSLGYTPFVTTTVPVTAGAASALAVSVQPPSSTTSGAVLTPAPKVQITDVGGNARPVAGQHVVASISIGNGTLSGTTDVVTDAAGVATFSNLVITGSPGSRQLTFTNATYGSVNASTPVNVTVGAPNDLLAVSSTSVTGAAGTTIGAQPTVRVRDAAFTGIPGVSVTFTASGAGSTISDGSSTGSTITVTTDATGMAKVTSWTLGPSTSTSYTITASSAGVTPVVFTATATAGAPASIVLIQSPTTGGILTTPAQSVVAQVLDSHNNPVSGTLVTFFPKNGNVTNNGTPTSSSVNTAANGQAGTTWKLSRYAKTDSLVISLSAFPAVPSVTATSIATAGPATQVVFLDQPHHMNNSAYLAGGRTAAPLHIALSDSGGVDTLQVSGSITLSLQGGTAGATLSGTLSASLVNGVATFNNFKVDKVGTNYTIVASGTGSSGPISASSSPFPVIGGATDIIKFAQQPTGTTANSAISPPIVIAVTDSGGNVVDYNGANVTLAIASGTSGAVLSNGGPVVTSHGLATFSNLRIDRAGTYTLTATSDAGTQYGPPVSAIVSTSFVIGAQTPATLTTIQGSQVTTVPSSTIPSGIVKFQVKDASLNPVGAGVQVDLGVYSGPEPCATATGSVTTASDGTATTQVITGANYGLCVVVAKIHGVGPDSAIAKVVSIPAATTHVWFGGTAATAHTVENSGNWLNVSTQLNELPGSTSNVYIPFFASIPTPTLGANRTVNNITMDADGTFDLNAKVLTATGSILIVNESESTAAYPNGTVIATGHNVDVYGDFKALTVGTAGSCSGPTGGVANIVAVNVAHAFVANCGAVVTTLIAGGVVANAGSFVRVAYNGYLSASDSGYFRGDSLVVNGSIDIGSAADFQGRLAMFGESPNLSIAGDATFRGNGVVTGGTIDLHGNVTFGGAGSGGYGFTGGNLNLDGNFTQIEGGTGPAYVASSNHYEYFQGAAPQTISFANGELSTSSFGTLQIANTAGVTFLTGSNQPSDDSYRSIIVYDGTLNIPAGKTVLLAGYLALLDSPAHLNVNGTMTIGYCSENDGTIAGTGTINGGTPSSLYCYGDYGYTKIPKRAPRKPAPRLPAALARPRVK